MIRILSLFALTLLSACSSDRMSWNSAAPTPPPVPVVAPQPNLYTNPQADLILNPPSTQPKASGVQINQLPDMPNAPKIDTPKVETPKIDKPKVVASLPVAPVAPRPNLGPLGSWNVKDAEGSCRITLSSQAFFDYQRASSNCKGASLSRVNAWEKRGGEVILYEPGGKIAARLSEQGGNSFAGSTSKGADVTMSR